MGNKDLLNWKLNVRTATENQIKKLREELDGELTYLGQINHDIHQLEMVT